MSDPIERVHFTYGQLLGEDDLRTEQDYHRKMRWLHNRMLHGTGVVTGFDISVDPDSATVEVSPGYAVDPLGRELMSDRIVRLTARARCAQASMDGESWIVARWAEQLTCPALSLSATGQEFTRVREYAHIEILHMGPEPESADLVLAKLTYDASDIPTVDVSVRPLLLHTRLPG